MNELDPVTHKHWIDWRIVSKLRLLEAAYLLGGYDAQGAGNGCAPSNVVALLRELSIAVTDGKLVPLNECDFDINGNAIPLEPDQPILNQIDARLIEVKVSDLAKWADAKGIEHHWPTDGDLSPVRFDISRYPEELRVAMEAFDAVSSELKPGRSPKQGLLDWLEKHKPEIGANARERIATMANWQKDGGLYKTPGG